MNLTYHTLLGYISSLLDLKEIFSQIVVFASKIYIAGLCNTQMGEDNNGDFENFWESWVVVFLSHPSWISLEYLRED